MSTLHCSQESHVSVRAAQMLSPNFKKSFTGNWNPKMEQGNDSFGRASGYPDTPIPGTARDTIWAKRRLRDWVRREGVCNNIK